MQQLTDAALMQMHTKGRGNFRKRELNSTFPDAGVTAMLGCMIEMDGWGDGRGVVRGS
jgi:hypothetical protein